MQITNDYAQRELGASDADELSSEVVLSASILLQRLNEVKHTKPDSCPKYLKCNAPICPLDTDWQKRVLLHDDPTCFYLTESVKDGAEVVFKGAGLHQLYAEIVRATPEITERWARIKKALERSKLKGARMTRTLEIANKAKHGGGDHG